MNKHIEMLLAKLAPYDANLTRLCCILDPDSNDVKMLMRNKDTICVSEDWKIREWETFSLRDMHRIAENISYTCIRNYFFNMSVARPEDNLFIALPSPLWNKMMACNPCDRFRPRLKSPFGAVHSLEAVLDQAVRPTLLHTTARKSILDAISEIAIKESYSGFHEDLVHWLYTISLITELPADFTKRVKHAGFYERNLGENNYFPHLLYVLLDRNTDKVEKLWEFFAEHIKTRTAWKDEPLPDDMMDIFRRVFFRKLFETVSNRHRSVDGGVLSKCKGLLSVAPYINEVYYARHLAEVINQPTFSVDFNTQASSLINSTELSFLNKGRYMPVVSEISPSKLMTLKKLIMKGV